jgi:hypothetical protein
MSVNSAKRSCRDGRGFDVLLLEAFGSDALEMLFGGTSGLCVEQAARVLGW